MIKNMLIAAFAAAVACPAAQASGSALETLNSFVNKDVVIAVSAASSAPEGSRGDRVYANSGGCKVTVVQGEYGSTLAIRDGRQEAVLGVSNDFARGSISAYCNPAAVSGNGAGFFLSCGKQANGFFRTRGEAAVEMSDGGIASVKVHGEVRRALVWFTDKEITCDGLEPVESGAAGASEFSKDAAAQRSIDGWLDEKPHDHIAKDPNGSHLHHILYVTLVKNDDKLYLQSFLPGHATYLADFITSPAHAREDLAALRTDEGHPYMVAFETYSTTVPRTNMLVVAFDGSGLLRFAIVQKFPTSEIKEGKFKPFVPSDSAKQIWSPWVRIN